jgi:HAD superfamily hydrolase (TIGR01509 family)
MSKLMTNHETREPHLKAVIFDMDGVLVFSEPLLTEACMKIFEDRGFQVRREEFKPFTGMGEARFMGGVAERHGIPFDPIADKELVYQVFLEMMPGRLEPLPGVPDFIYKCKQAGLKVALASSADDVKVYPILKHIGIEPSDFDVIVTGSMVSRKKPAPDVFLEAVKRLEVPAASCLVIEDAVSGIEAALAAGCRAMGLTTAFHDEILKEAGADWTAKNLDCVDQESLNW